MLNETIEIFLGCIHEFVSPDYWNLCDTIFVPSACGVILISVCAFVIAVMRTLSALIIHDTKK